MFRVKLLRGLKPPVAWIHEHEIAAIARAIALAELHSTTYTRDENGDYIIDASEYYSKGALRNL